MSTNKHAIIRYQALDKCFGNFGRKYFMDDLIEVCNNALYEHSSITNGVKRRQLFEDIKFMESDEGYRIPLMRHKEGQRIYYRYENKDFSINQRTLTPAEIEQLRHTILMLSRFKGLPQFEWIPESLARLEDTFGLHNSEPNSVIFFEQNPYLRGLELFPDLFSTILSKQVLCINYSSGFKAAHAYTIHPYALKQHCNRWYLIGLEVSETQETRLLTLAIDRIEQFEPLNIPFVENKQIDFDEYFDDVLGITIWENEPLEPIILKIDPERYNFIASKPIHHSQKLKEKTDDSVIIEITLKYNYELESLLLEFADSAEILSPQSIKKRICERAKRVLEVNGK